MKKLILILTISLACSVNAFAGHGVERGLVKIEDKGLLKDFVASFLAKKLSACAQGSLDEVFQVLSVVMRKHKVDNGIIDYYYDVKLAQVGATPELGNEIAVTVADYDYSNWEKYEEKLSSEISYDKLGFCRN